ncbi:hypothetical protein [Marivita hallyeonensis]|uniref:hypothetical protein n=1 Tax=Marivita hallyeonensis TaxID=996342 RepID=UPI0009324941|nr:hypothetical protein [Marivita hallyeonensis]
MADRYEFFLKNESVVRANKNGSDVSVKGLEFEQTYSLSSRHFTNSFNLLLQLEDSVDADFARNFGMLAFLSAAMGLEAFINAYFLRSASETEVHKIRKIVQRRDGSLKDRTRELLKASGIRCIHHSEIILVLGFLSEKRHELVHPKPVETTVEFKGSTEMVLDKLHVPPWPRYGDLGYCSLLLDWCLFLPASIALEVQENNRRFMLQWTGLSDHDPSQIVSDVCLEVRKAQKSGSI